MRIFLLCWMVGLAVTNASAVSYNRSVSHQASGYRPRTPGEDPVVVKDKGRIFEYRGRQYHSLEELLQVLEPERYYDVSIEYLARDEMVVATIKELIAGGLRINFVKQAVNNGPPPRFVRMEEWLRTRQLR